MAWSLDDSRIASGGMDTTVQVWDATTGKHVFIYRGHALTVAALAWSPTGQFIASASSDGTVGFWQPLKGT